MKKLFTLIVVVLIIPNVWSQEVATPINNINSIVTTNWGRVGIGTTKPSEKLDVGGTVRANRFRLQNTASFNYTGDKSFLSPTSSSQEISLLMSKVGFVRLNAFKGQSVLVSTNDVTRMRITGAGNVGIGLDDPSERLEVAGYIKTRAANPNQPNGISINSGKAIIESHSFPNYGSGRLKIAQGNTTSALFLYENKLRFGKGMSSPTDIAGLIVDDNLQVGGYSVFKGKVVFNDEIVFGNEVELPQTSFSENVGIGISIPEEKLHILDGKVRIQSTSGTDYNSSLGAENLVFSSQFSTYSLIHRGGPVQQNGLHIVKGTGYDEGGVHINALGKVSLGKYRPSNADVNMNGTVLISPLENLDLQMPSGYQLAVDGKILCEELRVKLSETWGDYVFDEKYELMTLSELKSYIDKNQHLPGIASARQLEVEGVETGEMFRQQMVKIEELTLYVLELQKQIEVLQSK